MLTVVSKSDPLARIQQALADLAGADGAPARLDAVRRLRTAAETLERHAVRGAREDGMSWSRIGSVYGLTKQGAQQRFHRAEREKKPVKQD